MSEPSKPSENQSKSKRRSITVVLLLTVILVMGASLRLMNNNWDDSYHLHPDERFLSQVIAQIQPVDSISEYFDTENSSLNPNTYGFTFFVYGTFPLFVTRYVGEWTGQTGYDLNTLIGRQLSATMDVLTILIVFLIAYRLYNDRVGLIAAALYAFAVLPIQQSHFMTVDTFTNTFGMLTVLAAVNILKREGSPADETTFRSLLKELLPYLYFGLALGFATASKINAVSLAVLLPFVELVCFNRQTNLKIGRVILQVGLAAGVSFLTFRILQPYAFSGPGFFDLGINQDWWLGLRSLQVQATGAVDFPPALQWVRRPATFSLSNLLIWGLGLPWGITAVLSWLGMGWRIGKHKEFEHAPIWVWILLYYLWQGLAWVSSMRYLLLLYPLLAVVAAWGLSYLIQRSEPFRIAKRQISARTLQQSGIILTVVVLLATAAWAFAFSRIYTEPVTRVQATDWIYENLEGPINLQMNSAGNETQIPVQYRAYTILYSGQSLPLTFSTPVSAYLMELNYPMVQSSSTSVDTPEYQLQIFDATSKELLHDTPFYAINPLASDGLNRQAVLNFNFNQTIHFEADRLYQFVLTLNSPESQAYLSGVPTLSLYREDGLMLLESLPKINEVINANHPYTMKVSLHETGEITQVVIPKVVDYSMNPEPKTLRLTLSSNNNGNVETASGEFRGKLSNVGDGRGEEIVIQLENPLTIEHAQDIDFYLELQDGEGEIMISTPGIALESSWDDGLPLPRPGMIPYYDGAGLFRGDLNFEMYWPDDANKRERFYQVLDQADYIIMSSNRQFGTIPRVPERYPLSIQFYRELLNCPVGQDTLVCYYEAEGEQVNPDFGFDLVKTFTSYPRLGTWEFNDQYAEEAFSVYDHPKVLIFKKNEHYDSEHILALLNEVDLSNVQSLTPQQLEKYDQGQGFPQSGLMLSEENKQLQQAGGTWSELFDREGLVNKYPWLGVVALYIFMLVLGWVVYPLVRLAFSGLSDKGYAFGRIVGLLLFTMIAFNLGSMQVLVTRQLLFGILFAILIVSGTVAWVTRFKMRENLKDNWKLILIQEAIFLVAFLLFLWIRYNNPDLWHPWRGGEKPMDFSYLNAAIKSSSFPAYDPWYAGGYINYYYYGQILVAMPIKLLGVIPSVAYNICLALWYAMLVLGVFSIGWNLTWFVFSKRTNSDGTPGYQGTTSPKKSDQSNKLAFLGGITSVALLAFLGNLGEIKVIGEGLALLGSSGADITQANFGQFLGWAIKGIAMLVGGAQLPIGSGSWYWNPSRTIPGEPITEFPAFTFLYADFHAHLIAMPIVMAAVAWGLSLVMKDKGWTGDWKKLISRAIPVFLIGAMIVGALQPTNTWDYLTFTIFNICVILFVGWRDLKSIDLRKLPLILRKSILPLLAALVFFVLSRFLYANFNDNFFPGYNSIAFWEGARTPIRSYLLHWGLILFLIAWWFAWELYQWMAKTKMSQLPPWIKNKRIFASIGILIGLIFLGLLVLKVSIALLAVPLATLALVLLLTSDDDVKRLAYFMIGTGLLLTIVVELVYLVGDIGRMNVVFKLYHQAWMLLTLPLGLAVVSLFIDHGSWRVSRQYLFQIPLFILVFIALLFPLLAGQDKMTDRMSQTAPHTLDGMKYMESSTYDMNGIEMDLGQDYRAILWMQDNVEGSPVILEAQAYEYRWGNRFTIYTGLPGVVGWNYHQRQQRAIMQDNAVQRRVDEVNDFYNTSDGAYVTEFLEFYDVEYIILGQQEMAIYSFQGLEKFNSWNGELWDEVYRDADTTIYKVR